MRSPVIEGLLRTESIRPVLVDLGASGEAPSVWQAIARQAVYIGFDPDRRELRSAAASSFATTHIVPCAVTADGSATTRLFLTKSPFCSSTLEPDYASLQSYLLAPLFEVDSVTEVPASTLGTALEGLGLSGADWFKADTQGTDLRIFQSLPDSMQTGVLAVDVEPGLIDAYQGEDLFVETHSHLVSKGFWLSRLDVKGAVRMTNATKCELEAHDESASSGTNGFGVRESPAWCEARYLRTVASLEGRLERDWILSWVFSMLDDQPGFALDLVRGFERRFNQPSIASLMRREAMELILQRRRLPAHKRIWRRFLPRSLRRSVFRVREWLSPDR